MKEFNKALNYSFSLLKYRARSKSEIESRLKLKGYDSSIIVRVIKYLQEANFINDCEFTRLFTAWKQEKGWGERKIALALKRLGVDKDLINEALRDKEIFRKKIKELIERKINYYQGENRYQKILRYLISRGFSYSDARAALNQARLEAYEH